MKRSILAAIVLLGLSAAGAAAQGSPLVGLRARALPERYRTVDGAVIVGPRAISWDVVDAGTARWLALSISVAAPDSAGGAELDGAPIVDATLVAPARGELLLFADCTADDQADPMIAALVRPAESGRPRVLRAWRPDLLAKRIVELPAATVACELVPEA